MLVLGKEKKRREDEGAGRGSRTIGEVLWVSYLTICGSTNVYLLKLFTVLIKPPFGHLSSLCSTDKYEFCWCLRAM